jgi:hypothetical protein
MARRLLLLAASLLAACAVPVSADASSRITVTADPRLPPDVVRDAQDAADATAAFLRDTYGLELTRPVEIILVADRATFRQALIDRLKFTRKAADQEAKYNEGVSRGNIILSYRLNAASSKRERYSHISHEVIHQYQREVASFQPRGKITWVWEGMANVIGAQVLERRGVRTIRDSRTAWLNYARKNAAGPRLEVMTTSAEWFAAMDRFGIRITYVTADLAVDLLSRQKGYPALIAYLRNAKTLDGPSAFQKAFGVTLAEFARDFPIALQRELSRP